MRIKCTFEDCDELFSSEKGMKRHKIDSDEHDYCHKCDEDFADIDAYVTHKIYRPDMHNKACRICGEEFKSSSGLKGHIDWYHKVDQKLKCIGCGEGFGQATLLIEHMEFGHCKVIDAAQFLSHIVHKALIDDLIKDPNSYVRLMQKTEKYEAAQDRSMGGGVRLSSGGCNLDEPFDSLVPADNVSEYRALQPDVAAEPSMAATELFPSLPSNSSRSSAPSDVISGFNNLSLATSVINSRRESSATSAATTPVEKSSAWGPKKSKASAWGAGDSKATAAKLFPDAPRTDPPRPLSPLGRRPFNILKTRFWDPSSIDWNPNRFYDSVTSTYHCPFICEQTFALIDDQVNHITSDHRMTRMKCPMCLKYFKHATALMAHCEGLAVNCGISKADDYPEFLAKITGGFLSAEHLTRPDHFDSPTVRITHQSGEIEHYRTPKASYMQYSATVPVDYQKSKQTTILGKQL